jgi:hypothetical protein
VDFNVTSTTDQIFNFPLENAIRKVQESQMGLEDNIDTIKKNMETVIDACKEGTYCIVMK